MDTATLLSRGARTTKRIEIEVSLTSIKATHKTCEQIVKATNHGANVKIISNKDDGNRFALQCGSFVGQAKKPALFLRDVLAENVANGIILRITSQGKKYAVNHDGLIVMC